MSKRSKRRAAELMRKINEANLGYDDMYTLVYVAQTIKDQVRN